MFKRLFALVTLSFIALSAHAFMPSPGLWYNPAESGRGWTIDYQNGTMAVASYVYDGNGKPIWYLSAGHYNAETNTFSASLDAATGGQCLGCPYIKPTVLPNAGGLLQIVFNSWGTATVYFPGGSSPLVHYVYGFDNGNGPDPKQNLYGEWVLSYNSSYGLSTSHWLIFDSTYTANDGTQYMRGHIDGAPSKIALGGYVKSSKTYLILISTSIDDWYDTYALTNFDNVRVGGLGYLDTGKYKPTSYLAWGSRLFTKDQLIGPGIPVSSVSSASKPLYEHMTNAWRTSASSATVSDAADVAQTLEHTMQ